MVLAGNAERIVIPELAGGKLTSGRLRGLRLLHTHLNDEGVSQEDLMDLLFLRLDSLAALTVNAQGQPGFVQYAHLDANQLDPPYSLSPLTPWDTSPAPLATTTANIEAAFLRKTGQDIATSQRAILVSVSPLPHKEQEHNLHELAQLAKTAGIAAKASIIQRSATINPRFILGKGKIAELEVLALEHNADTLLFDGELTPAQLNNLAEVTERRVLDRTQLILDIFAQHAKSKAGKLQVELAQLRYLQPRLVGKNKALDRLMGGIGGRGPGETKLETDRRKNRERIRILRRELDTIGQKRAYLRSRRKERGLPLAALVGYTNAGKSTLLNALSKSHVLTENKLFATLDAVSRRLRFPQAQELILADTIGFIRNLPDELLEAFQATLDDLHDCDLLVHVVDAANPSFARQIQSVNQILENLEVAHIPTLLVFNKWDETPPDVQEIIRISYPDGIAIAAKTHMGLNTLEDRILAAIFHKEQGS